MKKKLSCLIIVLVTFFFLSETCKAEPDSTIQYLMNEPVSMLEWGLFRLEQHLNRQFFKPKGKEPNCTVRYYSKENRIKIGCENYDENKNVSEAKSRCKLLLMTLRPMASPLIFEHSFYHSMFYRLEREPKDLAEKLRGITEIVAVAYYGDKNSSVICTGPLLGEDIYFKE